MYDLSIIWLIRDNTWKSLTLISFSVVNLVLIKSTLIFKYTELICCTNSISNKTPATSIKYYKYTSKYFKIHKTRARSLRPRAWFMSLLRVSSDCNTLREIWICPPRIPCFKKCTISKSVSNSSCMLVVLRALSNDSEGAVKYWHGSRP